MPQNRCMKRRSEYEEVPMSEYMLLLYAPESDEKEELRRWDDLPLWFEVTESLREAGLLIRNGPLHPVTTATTVRMRDGDVELTDGPFAVTKEQLVGYYLIECIDLDLAVKAASRLPVARYGSVEVRPVRSMCAPSNLD
jgi:hypothetical protein